jgi:hypothetical protein
MAAAKLATLIGYYAVISPVSAALSTSPFSI